MDDYRRDDETSRRLRRDLMATLVNNGAIRNDVWNEIFTSVPRHVFAPHIFVSPRNDGVYEPIDGTDPAQRDRWLRYVYDDDICVTQLDGDDDAWHTALTEGTVRAERKTCTSSQPSLMANILDELNLSDHDRVLEIGTGTGYNAALLCERLGSSRIVSVDIDDDLVNSAREYLKFLGYSPTLAVSDGEDGYPQEKFTKIVTTASFPNIPKEWLDQVSDGGTIVANLFRPLGGGILATLTVVEGQATGHFSTRTASYMPTRVLDTSSALNLYQRTTESDENSATAEPHDLNSLSILADRDARFYIALMSDLHEIKVKYPNYPEEQWFLTDDGSWAFSYPTDTGFAVKQGGSRRLWDEFARHHGNWTQLGRPERNRFGITVTTTDERIWLDNPTNPIAVQN